MNVSGPPSLVVQDRQPALWSLSSGQPAVCLFSQAATAELYREQFASLGEVWTPQPIELAQTLKECWLAGVRWAVLDPSADQSRQAIDLGAVLRNIRDSLRAGQGLPS
jgi:hypothetical protein